MIWNLQIRRQINWKISPSFVAVLENLNFIYVFAIGFFTVQVF